MKTLLSVALKLGFIALCFTVILKKVPLRDVGATLATASLPLIALALATVLMEPLVMAYKWRLLLKTKGIVIGFRALSRIIFKSNFLGSAIPSGMGADALRILMLKGRQHSVTHSTGSLIADRVMAAVSLVVLSLTGLLFVWPDFPDHHTLMPVIAIALLTLALTGLLLSRMPVLLIPWVQNRLIPWLERHAWLQARGIQAALRWITRAAGKAEDIHASLRSFAGMPATLTRVFLLNVGIQALRTVQIHLLFRAVHYPVPVVQEMAFFPIIILLILMPVSYFGLGIKEGAFLYFFGQAGVPREICLSVSFVTYILTFSVMLPGAFFALLDLFAPRAPPAAPGAATATATSDEQEAGTGTAGPPPG